jgi:next-to-BRCA1 protein 1
MGDRDRRGRTTSKSTETTPTTSTNAATQVRTVAELHPSEPVKAEEEKTAVIETTPAPVAVKQELVAHFINDAVPDGTVLPSNCIFEQTWTLQNGGEVAWPAGCSLKYVGGDYMCAIDVEHPASVQELAAATESSSNSAPVEPGHDFGFTVLMRTPPRAGRAISYWRLTDPEGNRFGHRLWCDITVEVPALAPVVKEEPMELAASTTQKEAEVVKEEIPSESSSQMIFPKLEKESPTASVHQAATEMPAPVTEETLEAEEEFSDVEDGESVDDGFLTDEEYDILDASDEEYLAEQENSVKK